MISFLNYYTLLNGCMTSLLDIHYEYPESEFIMYVQKDRLSDSMLTRTQYPHTKMTYLGIEDIKNRRFDVLVTNPNTLYRFYDMHVFLKYNYLVIIDSATFFIDSCYGSEHNRYLESLPNKTIFGNTYNSGFFARDYEIYYHKFSRKRLNHIGNIVPEFGVLKDRNESNDWMCKYYRHAHSFDSLFYKRHYSINGIYFENIGKLIFEYAYFGKDVFYSCENKKFNDGLSEYLTLFNIDDSLCQKIDIPKESIESILVGNINIL